MVHSHIAVAEAGNRIHGRDLGGHRRVGGKGAAGVAGAVQSLGEDGVGAVVARFDDDIVGLGHADAKLLHRYRLDVLAVGGNHCHVQPRDAHIEEGHCRAVDKAQPDLLAAAKQPGPARGWGLAVHQECIGVACDVGKVAVGHAHLVPHLPIGPGTADPFAADIGHQVGVGALAEVVVVAEFFQLAVNVVGILVGPVREHHHVVAVIAEGFRLGRVDDNGAVQPGLFLEAGVAVIPVGAALQYREAVGEGLARLDPVETGGDAGHAVHRAGKDDAVPVDGAVDRQHVGDIEGDSVALAPA